MVLALGVSGSCFYLHVNYVTDGINLQLLLVDGSYWN